MHVQTGPEGCIFHHPSPCQASEIHPFSIRRENLSIQLSPIRANISPSHFHQGSQTNWGHAKKNGCPDDSLFERHAHYEEHLTACQRRHPESKEHSRESRICDKRGEIHFPPVQVIEFLGIMVDSVNMSFLLPQ